MTNKRIGFACKLSELDNKGQVQSVESCNTKTTTVAWLARQDKQTAEQRLAMLMEHNVQSVRNLVTAVSKLPELQRMVRISSDILPVYTYRDWSYFYQNGNVQNYLHREFANIGSIARAAGVRLSFHPGQFCCIVSNNPGIVQNSLEELEYHASMGGCRG